MAADFDDTRNRPGARPGEEEAEPVPAGAIGGGARADLGSMLGAGLAILVAVAALAATGLLDATARNGGLPFVAGLAAVVLGGAVWVLAAIIAPRLGGGGLPGLIQLAGVAVAFLGILVVLVTAIRTGGDVNHPSVVLTLAEDGRAVAGRVTVPGLGADDRLTVHVDGLTERRNGRLAKSTIYEAAVGADEDGNAATTFSIPVPAGADAVGVQAWTDRPVRCATYPLGRRQASSGGTGCAILRLR